MLAACPCIFADDVVANIQVLSLHKSIDFVLEFFDNSLFDNDARIYNHDLAGTSMCMAMSAFRPYKSESDLVSSPDEKLLVFLTSAGFSDFVSDDYDKNPSLYTVATAIGRKAMTDSEGNPYTLIAVGVCGGGYADEWLSNLTVGNGNRHKGFDSAAHSVVNRIFGYIGTRNIQGRIKIWISGYSRAAAISNIAAADLTSSGYFREEDIFAYTFATPNTVKNPEREYANIFNIVGQYDIVPMVPLSVWGFKRYGTVLTTPLQETDSDYLMRLASGPDLVHRLFTELPYWNNVEMNNELHTMLSFLGEICPTSEIYELCMQDRLISMMKNRNPVNILRNLFEMADDPRLITDENREEADQFINRFARLVYIVLTGSKYDDQWNSETPVFVNLVHEHGPEVYFSWVLGADPEVAFTNNHSYATVAVYILEPEGAFKYKVVDEEDNSEIAVIEGNSVTYLSEDFHPHVTVSPEMALFRLPVDGTYSIVVETTGSCDCDVIYIPTDPAGLSNQDVYLKFKELKEGSSVVFTTNQTVDLDEWDMVFSEDDSLNTNQIRAAQGYETLPFNWRTIIISIIIAPVLLIMLLTWLALFVTSKIRKTGFKSLDYLLVCVLLLLVVFDGIFIMIVRYLAYQIIIRTLIAMVIVGLYFKRKKVYSPVTTLLIAFSLADITLIFNRYISTFILVGAYVYMIVICLKGRKIPVNRVIYWAVASIVTTFLMIESFGIEWYEFVVLCISMAVPFAAWDRNQSMRIAGVLFVLKQILLIAFIYTQGIYMSLFFAHTAINYLALLILALGGNHRLIS